jgi:glutathionylspermidine synthase
LELLSSPTSLESKQGSKDETERLNRLEQTLLERGLMSPGIEEFGLSGVDIGFASWDGVSYFQLKNEHGLQESLVEFEIAVQSLWWMCKYLADLYLSNDSQQMRIVRKYIPELKQHFTRIKNIAATESPSRRTMAEAILNTSRLKQIVEEAIGLCEQKGQ